MISLSLIALHNQTTNITESLFVVVREATRSKEDLGRALPECVCLFAVSPVRGPLQQPLMFAPVLAPRVV